MNKKLLPIIISGFTVLHWTQSQAQESGATARPALEQVIVTARRDEELIQQVPLAVTALSAENLERQGVQSADQLLQQVPALSQDIQGAQKSTTLFTIRGVGTEDALIPMDTAVGTYFAEAPQSRPGGFAKSFFDLANVQVLKGPQGTLFGRNTTGGAILVEPNAPVEHLEAEVKATYLDHELGDGSEGYGMVNFGTDPVWIRLAGKMAKRDGFYKNVVTGQLADDEDYSAFRASIRFAPTDSLENTLIYDYYDSDDNGTAMQMIQGSGPLFAASAALQETLDDNEFQSELGSGLPNTFGPATHKLSSRVKNEGVVNRTTFDIHDNLRIKNIASYRELHSSDFVDFDGSFAIAPASGVGFTTIASRSDVDNRMVSEELQLQGTSFDDRLNWVVGGFYFNENGDDLSQSVTFGSPGNVTGGTGENTSYALFAQGTYELPVDGLSLTLGLRNTWDEREFTIQGTTYGSNPAVSIPAFLAGAAPTCRQRQYIDPANPAAGTVPKPLADCATTTTGDADEYTYNITINYQIDPDKMVYVAHRRGYRSFAYNPRAELPSDFDPVPAEIVEDVEGGLKADWDFGIPVRTNLAVFYSKFDNMQRQRVVITPSGTVGTVLFSAEETHIQGAELEFTILPVEGLDISGYYSYTDGEYDKFDAPGPGGTIVDLSNRDKFSRSPKDKFGVTVAYTWPTAPEFGEVNMRVGYVWQSDVNYDVESNVQQDPTGNSSDIPFGEEEGYGLVDARIDWTGVMGTRFDVALFGSNLTDERYHTGILSLAAGASGRFTAGPLGDPRVIGVEAGYRFE